MLLSGGNGESFRSLWRILDAKHFQKGRRGRPGDEPSRPSTPKPLKDIKVYCEISFTHTITDALNESKGIVVGGRVDHGVGIACRSMNTPNRRFHSLLLCVEAKVKGNLESALGQLIVYLASLRRSRINRGKSDSSVYGVATDGLKYLFVTITHGGILQQTKQFDIMDGGLPAVLGSFRFILNKAISPTISPKSGVLQNQEMGGVESDVDEPFGLDGNSFVKGDSTEDEDGD